MHHNLSVAAFYGVCCIDECEALLGHLERRLGAPTALLSEIVGLVSALPSASQAAKRTLPTALVGRLGEVAEHHGGRVPLHGRLFALWMHHAAGVPPERAEVAMQAKRRGRRPSCFNSAAGAQQRNPHEARQSRDATAPDTRLAALLWPW